MEENNMERPILSDKLIMSKEIGAEISASWLTGILRNTYGRHNLSSSEDKVADDIRAGRLKPFFIVNGDYPVCCAALIFNPNSVEIGRVANAPDGKGGGNLMLQAIDTWIKDEVEVRPLVAEVRMAASFEGIAGGQGSQATLLKKIGMVPQALLPAFHHPGPNGPDRQEIFCFSSLEKIRSPRIAPAQLTLPDLPQINAELIQTLLNLNGFATDLQVIKQENIVDFPLSVNKLESTPFNLFIEDEKGTPVDQFKTIIDQSPFDLLAINAASSQLIGKVLTAIKSGFVLAGVSAPHEGPLRLLFGRLRKCLLAPTELMRDFPGIDPNLILQVHQQFHEQSRKN